MRTTATMIDGMRAQTVGRVLGVGLRVAGRIAGQRLAGNSAAPPVTVASVGGPGTQQRVAAARQAAAHTARVGGSVARGVGGFLRPFRRVGGIVFLEVAGVFFLLFVLVFGTMAWRLRSNYSHGPDHARFLVAAVMMLVFLYLSVTSFWRAKRK